MVAKGAQIEANNMPAALRYYAELLPTALLSAAFSEEEAQHTIDCKLPRAIYP